MGVLYLGEVFQSIEKEYRKYDYISRRMPNKTRAGHYFTIVQLLVVL